MQSDITNRQDVELLVNSFYDDVRKDEVIGFIFNRIIGDDWSHHLPIMYNFWETVLFGVAGYRGNPVQKHVMIDKQIPLQDEHYQRWHALWTTTVDKLFAGEKADEAKSKAQNMIQLISMKVSMAKGGNSIF